MFPLETYTYPLTRNIKVEIAVIIIIAAFGVISQLRLWKVIKERRAKEKSTRKEAERMRDEAEAEVGRHLEQNNLRERVEWEHMYGNSHDAKVPSLSETAVADDSRRGSDALIPSIREKGCSFEMKDMSSPENSAGVSDTGKPLGTVDEVIPNKLENIQGAQVQHDHEEQGPHGVDYHGQGKTTSFIPNQDVDDDSEHGAVAASETDTVRSLEHFSGVSWTKRLSWRSADGVLPRAYSQSEKDFAVHDDTTSSVAGEADDLRSFGSRGSSITADVRNVNDETTQDKDVPKTSPPEMKVSANVAGTEQAEKETSAAHNEGSENENIQGRNDDNNQENNAVKQTTETQLNDHGNNQPERPEALELEAQPNPQTVRSEPRHSNSIARGDETQASAPIAAASEYQPAVDVAHEPQDCAENTGTDSNPQSQKMIHNPNERATLDVTAVQGIPEQTSKVVHAFRTKEWAKHLVDADTPEPEPLDLDREIRENPGEMEEVAAPVNVDDLLQTAFDAQPPPAVRNPQHSFGSVNGRFYSSVPSKDISHAQERGSSHNDSLIRSLQLLSQNGSAPMVRQQQEQAYEAPPMQRSTSTPSVTAPPSNGKHIQETNAPIRSRPPSLLARRENRLRNRLSSTSSRYDAWMSRRQSRQSFVESTRMTSPTFSIPEEREEDLEEAQSEAQDNDNVPLAKRRAMLQRQTMQSPSATSFQSSESPGSPRGSLDRSAATMAVWRQSVREDISLKRDPLGYQKSSVDLERPRSLWGSVQQMRDASATTVDHAIAEGMQWGNMTDLHRQAMRRMQASVNRQL